MRVTVSRRPPSVSRVERVASFAAAVGVTIGAGLVMMLAPGHGFLDGFKLRQTASLSPDRVVYVAPARVVQPRSSVVRPRVAATNGGARSTMQTPATPGSDIVESNAAPTDTAAATPKSARVESTTSPPMPPKPSGVSAGAPSVAAPVGFTHLSEPLKFDSAVGAVNKRFKEGLAGGLLQPPPPTQDEIDAKLRAEALEAIAARGAGAPVPRVLIGAGIPVGLPGGGPSNKQRARDRAIFAELQKSVALRQQKAESVATARKRRVDSLALLADSGRRRQQNQ